MKRGYLEGVKPLQVLLPLVCSLSSIQTSHRAFGYVRSSGWATPPRKGCVTLLALLTSLDGMRPWESTSGR